MSNKRIDLEHLEEDALMQDLNWSIARFEQVETLVRNMIAELKRCYEELDEANKIESAVWSVLDNWDICMDDYSMHDLYDGLNEKYARNHEGRIILKELHSYTEEDGWQPKEPASE